MTNQELVGRAMRARCNLALPTGHRVAAGEVFRYLQAHMDAGASAVLWLRARNVELADDDVTLPIPATPVDARGRRRSKALARAAEVDTGGGDDASGDDDIAPELADDYLPFADDPERADDGEPDYTIEGAL